MPTFTYLGLFNWKGTKRSYQLSNRASHRSSRTRILVISLKKVLNVYQMWKVVQNVCARSRRLFGVFVLVKGSLVIYLGSAVSYQRVFRKVPWKKPQMKLLIWQLLPPLVLKLMQLSRRMKRLV